jgi:hypothetical protein
MKYESVISCVGTLTAQVTERFIQGSYQLLNDSTPWNFYVIYTGATWYFQDYTGRMGEGRYVYRVLVGRPEGKRPLRRPKRRLEDNIKLDLREIGIDGANWIQLALGRVQWRVFVNIVMNLRLP